jgi:hypothetical protein
MQLGIGLLTQRRVAPFLVSVCRFRGFIVVTVHALYLHVLLSPYGIGRLALHAL